MRLQSGVWGHSAVDAATSLKGHNIIFRRTLGCQGGEHSRPKYWSRDCDGFGHVAIDNHGECMYKSGGYAIIIPPTLPTNWFSFHTQFFWRSMATGVLARGALIASIYERGVHLTGKERVKHTNAALVNHISTDVSQSYDLRAFKYSLFHR